MIGYQTIVILHQHTSLNLTISEWVNPLAGHV